ncbi:hypothetical protein EXVG_00236 [Emiliania huxleyi virus 202]|nr:hypothetical protein EXVG_00236 [Emiliania huxleyi virus 202]AHA54146.1 hypothetical protein EhV18_00099 [Emiliania huxleyi virus 18]AHA55192.1 hypothetical protein EhV156_00095 [Emiliania huxleyi virus 156]
MSICKITNDGIHIVNDVDVNKLHKREEVVIQPNTSIFRICLYTPDKPGTKVKQSSLLDYDLPPPFDNYLYNAPVYMQFNGGVVSSVDQAKKLLKLLDEIFVHTDESLAETSAIVYEKIENTESDDDDEEEVPEEYYDHNEESDNDIDEDVVYSEDDEDDESKLEDGSTMGGDDSSLK